MGPEARLEYRVCQAVKAAGGMCVKQTGMCGMPDRLCILPGGRHIYVEMKSPHGTTTPLQRSVIRRLEQLGCDVRVVRGEDETNAFIAELGEEVMV